jgi:DNA-binding transcriptional ArsR family regulator
MIEQLAHVDADTASNLADELPISRQAISKHFSVLADAGLVYSRQVGRERLYSLNPEPLSAANEWIDAISEQWDQRLQKLKTYLSEGSEDE